MCWQVVVVFHEAPLFHPPPRDLHGPSVSPPRSLSLLASSGERVDDLDAPC